jgi:hypothetical protein
MEQIMTAVSAQKSPVHAGAAAAAVSYVRAVKKDA